MGGPGVEPAAFFILQVVVLPGADLTPGLGSGGGVVGQGRDGGRVRCLAGYLGRWMSGWQGIRGTQRGAGVVATRLREKAAELEGLEPRPLQMEHRSGLSCFNQIPLTTIRPIFSNDLSCRYIQT